MTAQASRHAVAPTQSARPTQRRSPLATWAAVLTVVAALLGAGVCVTANQAYWPIAQAH